MRKKQLDVNSGGLNKQFTSSNDREALTKEALQHLRVIVRTTQAHSRWIERSSGVSGAQLWAMWELFARPGQKVSQLSKALSIHQSTTSNMLDKLEEKALIRRDRSGPDQRVVRLFLTSKGTELLSDAPRPAQGAIYDAMHSMADEDLQQLNQGLLALLKNMKVSEENAAMRPISED